MDSDLAGVIKIVMVCGTFLVAWVTFLIASRRRPPQADSNALSQVEARLERIEQAVDTIAIEVERVSEGQRFTSKLLAEREQASPRVPRAITPH